MPHQSRSIHAPPPAIKQLINNRTYIVSLPLQILLSCNTYYNILYLIVMSLNVADRLYASTSYSIATPIIYTVYILSDYTRLYLGYKGNLNESITNITAYYFLCIFPALICIIYFIFIQSEVTAIEIGLNCIQLMLCCLQILITMYHIRQLTHGKTARFSVEYSSMANRCTTTSNVADSSNSLVVNNNNTTDFTAAAGTTTTPPRLLQTPLSYTLNPLLQSSPLPPPTASVNIPQQTKQYSMSMKQPNFNDTSTGYNHTTNNINNDHELLLRQKQREFNRAIINGQHNGLSRHTINTMRLQLQQQHTLQQDINNNDITNQRVLTDTTNLQTILPGGDSIDNTKLYNTSSTPLRQRSNLKTLVASLNTQSNT